MEIDFSPQFHRRVVRNNRRVWIALPRPPTLIALKSMYYRKWQEEESLKLRQAGETVQPAGQERERIPPARLD